MKVLVVYSHPVPESFGAAVRDTVMATLQAGGHEVRLIDLYAMKFDPVMHADERRSYNDRAPSDPLLEEHIAALRWADGLVFVYPTWWYSMPAIMKGWFDRVWGIDVAFKIGTERAHVVPLMKHVKFLAVVTTCGAPLWISWLMGQPGRRIILRGIRALCAPRVKTLYLAHYLMDRSTPESRTAYLAKVRRKLSRV